MKLQKINIYLNNSGKIFLFSDHTKKCSRNITGIDKFQEAWGIEFNPYDIKKIPLGMGVFTVKMTGSDKQNQILKIEYDPYNLEKEDVVMHILGWQIPFENTIPIFSNTWNGLSLTYQHTMTENSDSFIMYLLNDNKIKFKCSNGYCIPDKKGDINNINDCLNICNIGSDNKPPLLSELENMSDVKNSMTTNMSNNSSSSNAINLNLIFLILFIFLIFLSLGILIILKII